MKYKRSLLASTLLVLGGTAQAQTSVTLYGLLDVGIEYKNHVPGSGTGSAGGTQVQMQSGNLLGSRWGLEGADDLGDGWRAMFNLESGFTLNDGRLSQGGRLFGRTSVIGIRNDSWGTLTVGRQKNLAYEYLWAYDALEFGYYSAYTMDSFLASRMDDSVRYVGRAAGVQFGAMYSTGFDSTIVNGAQVPGASKVGREYEVMIDYQGALPISAAVLYDQTQGTSIATQDNVLQRIVAALSYKAGNGSAFLGCRWLNGQNGAAWQSSNLFWTGASYYVTPALSVAAGAYHMQMRQSHNGPSSGVILVDYFLSKTTDFYAQGSKIWNSRATDVGLDGAGFGTGSGMSQTGSMIGVKHLF